MVLVKLAATDLVFGGKPQTGPGSVLRKRHYCPADAAHEPVHDRAQQRAPFTARDSPERQPGKDLGFRDRSPRLLLEHRRKLVQCARRSPLAGRSGTLQRTHQEVRRHPASQRAVAPEVGCHESTEHRSCGLDRPTLLPRESPRLSLASSRLGFRPRVSYFNPSSSNERALPSPWSGRGAEPAVLRC